MKILLADDHDLIRETLVMYLRAQLDADIVEVGDLAGAEKAVSSEGDRPFDVALLDYDMPGMNGLAGLTRICGQMNPRPVAILSGTASRRVAKEAMALGARGFLPKTMNARSMAAAVNFIASGETFVPYGYFEQDNQRMSGELTARETEVLRGLTEGRSNKDIGRTLGLQEVTVKLHVKTLCRKLDARNRTQAAMIARDRNMIT
ncbi:response regulator transcription factor [Paracoccus sp. TK19116]|uniref:Response regulator transcription factor n=1 Tax=Paracoccus albicereus TaxID=2922394 RepID=A0ABT1MQB7_9RHOB|nr:response regulator transcription factor [Paracoccus albicereus]MCQ0970507.1 response regulator transcription factor [Paracoccus albicereus]